MDLNTKSDVEAIEAFVEKYAELKKEIAKVIVGQDEVVKNILMAMFSRSHALLIGVPGLAKTLMITTIAKAVDMSYNRIQFTPDLMPSDIMGAEILDDSRNFKFVKGPIFANIVLADEINRTPPKTQSALLEAMQERSVSMNGTTYQLPDPFFVLATQNPIEQEGTYPLPEAQQDRFMFNILLDYPTKDEEVQIVKSTIHGAMQEPKRVLTVEDIITAIRTATDSDGRLSGHIAEGVLTLTGAEDHSRVVVYLPNGRQVAALNDYELGTGIGLPGRGIYVVAVIRNGRKQVLKIAY